MNACGPSSHQHLPPGRRRDALLRGEDSLEVQRVGGNNGDRRSRGLAAELAQQFNGLGEGELLAGEACDEAAAADFAAELQAPVDAGEGGPGDGEFFAGDGAAEDDAGAAEELFGCQLVELFGGFLWRLGAEDTPAANGTEGGCELAKF